MADGGISDNAIINETRPHGGSESGWASLGEALGGGAGGANSIAGQNAYNAGMRVGSQTADALAQAKDRIQKSDAAEQAAKALESPQLQAQLHLTPELGSYFATQARMGKDPKEVTSMMLENLQLQNRQKLADTSVPLSERHAAANSIDPGSLTPKAEGPLGSVFDPGANNGSGQTTVSSLQQRVAESDISLHNAQASAAGINAGAHKETADATAGGKLMTGNKWIADPQDPTGVMHDSQGRPVQGPDLNANKGEGAIGERYTRRVVNASNELAKETNILGKIGFDSTTGAQINGGHNGLLGTITENMGKAFSSEQSQQYKSSMAGISNQLGSLELAGGVAPGTYTKQLENAIQNSPTDTVNTRLQHAALIRQIAEVAAESASDNPKMSDQARQGIYRAVGQIQKNIPFTASEVQDYRHDGKKGQTFQQYLDSIQRQPAESFGTGSTAAPTAAPARSAAPSQADPLGILGK